MEDYIVTIVVILCITIICVFGSSCEKHRHETRFECLKTIQKIDCLGI